MRHAASAPPPPKLLVAVITLAAGGAHSCVVLRRGLLFCWGNNYQGQLQAPRRDCGGECVSVSAQEAVSCALSGTGQLGCWGNDQYGQVAGVAALFAGLLQPLVQSADVGVTHLCLLLMGGRVACLGRDVGGRSFLKNVDDWIRTRTARQGRGQADSRWNVVSGVSAGLGFSCAEVGHLHKVVCEGMDEFGTCRVPTGYSL